MTKRSLQCIPFLVAMGFTMMASGLPSLATATPASIDVGQRAACPCYSVLYRFGSAPDGAEPQSALSPLDGLLYGTTTYGGAHGGGTVFRFAPNSPETILFNFGMGKDGYNPGSLLAVNGHLFGTTMSGGLQQGTVFAMKPDGNEYTLHVFGDGNGSDGSRANGGLIDVDGVLYGTTIQGGVYGGGTVYSLTFAGVETVLHNFSLQAHGDGAFPNGDLVYIDGELYGTTSSGGAFGDGSVFKIKRDGTEVLLHSFGGGFDGKAPLAGLVALNGVLYGTTSGAGVYDGGIVFAITPNGAFKRLYAFGGDSVAQGALPGPGVLVALNGVLYGTTTGGRVRQTIYNGTIFQITPAGRETTLYTFHDGPDGHDPIGGLAAVGGTLYGTTARGGNGSGTIFSFTP